LSAGILFESVYNETMSVVNENSKTYLRELEKSELEAQLWNRLKNTPCQGSLWKKEQADPYGVEFNYELSKKAGFAYLYLSIDKIYAGIITDSYLGLTVFVKLKFSEENQLFTSGELSWDEAKSSFRLLAQGRFFITTKRSACRYTTTEVDRIQMSFAGHVFQCYDISSGGFSVLLKKDSVTGLSKGMSFEKGMLKYNLKHFEIPKIVLVNVIENKDQPDWVRLAFKFEGLKTMIEDSLWVEVNTSVKRLADLLG